MDAAAPQSSSGTLALPASFLASVVGLSGADLLRRLKEDQRQRWKRGERFLAEFYREKMPSLQRKDAPFAF